MQTTKDRSSLRDQSTIRAIARSGSIAFSSSEQTGMPGSSAWNGTDSARRTALPPRSATPHLLGSHAHAASGTFVMSRDRLARDLMKAFRESPLMLPRHAPDLLERRPWPGLAPPRPLQRVRQIPRRARVEEE